MSDYPTRGQMAPNRVLPTVTGHNEPPPAKDPWPNPDELRRWLEVFEQQQNVLLVKIARIDRAIAESDRSTVMSEGARLTLAGMFESIQRALTERLEGERDRMRTQCTSPPCLHAEGIDLAISWLEDEMRRMLGPGR